MAGSGNISKQVGGPIKADEIKWQGTQKKDDGAAAALATALGGGVTKPTPVEFPWTIYTVSSTEDDDKPGLYCLAIIDVPKDTMGLKIKGCYVKNNGAYGRVKWFPSYRLDDTERAAGRVEIQLGPFRPNSRFDIVRLVAVKRQAKDVGNPALGADDRRGKGTTPAYTPPVLPAWTAPYADQIPGDGLGPLTMGTILTGDYILGYPRILDVDGAKKEEDGIYFPVTIASSDNEALLVSVRMGVYRVGTKAGGANTYSKRIPTPRIELTEEQMAELADANSTIVDVGPLKANKKYHIRWIRGRYSLDPDDSGAKVIRHRWPLAAVDGSNVDQTLNYLPNATTPVYSVDAAGTAIVPVPGGADDTPPLVTGAPFLAVLSPTGDITDPPSNPNSSDIITNEPDDATEKDKDAIVVLRVWAAEGNRAKYLIDPADPTMVTWKEANVNRAAVVIKTLLPDGVTYKQRRHGIDIEDPDAVFVDITFHRQIGKPLVWVKNVSLNEADREFSSTIDLAFTAGSGDASDITGFTLTILNDSDDNRQADARVQWVNSATPPVAKKLTILRARSAGNPSPDAVPSTTADKANGNANWKLVFKKNLRADSDTLALPSSNVDIYHAIPGITDAAGDRDYIAYLWIAGNPAPVHSDTYNNAGEPADAGADSPIAGDTTYPSPNYLIRNGAGGDPADGNAEVVMRVYCDTTGGVSANTFADVFIRQVGVLLFGWKPDASTYDSGEKHLKTVEVDPTAKFVDISMNLKLAKKYTWWDTYAYNHDDTRTMSSGSPTGDFTAGTGGNSGTFGADALLGAYNFDAANLTSKAQVLTAVDARHTDVELEFVQPSIPVLLKKIFVEIKYGSNFSSSSAGAGSSVTEEAGTIRAMHDSILDDARQYSLASTSYTTPGIIRRVKHRKNQIIYFRSVFIPFGSVRNSANTRVTASASLTVTDDNVVLATALAAAPTNVIAKFKHGNLRLKCKAPTTGDTNNIMNYHWMVTDNVSPSSSTADFLDASDDDNSDGLEVIENTTADPRSNRIISGGPVTSIPVKKSVLTGLGSTIYVHVAIENNIGVSTNVATLAVTTANLVSGVYNDDEDIPVRRQFHGRGNLIDGGGCYNSAKQFADPDNTVPLATELGRNVRLSIGGTRVSTTSTPVEWTKNIHAITIATGGGTASFFWRMKGQLITGHKVALSFLYRISAALALTANTSFTMRATLTNSAGTHLLTGAGYVDITLAYDVGGGTAEQPWSTDFQTGVALMELGTNPDTQIWLKLYNIPQLASRNLIFDDICVVRGTVPALWEPGPRETFDPETGVTAASTGYTTTLNGTGLGSDSITTGGVLTL